ncbi:MAG: CrcB family protein [Nocardioidaceae bacterium]
MLDGRGEGSDPQRGRRAHGPTLWATIRERWDILLTIAAGGSLGTLARWGLGELIPHGADQIAFSTWIVNVTGAFGIGVLLVFVTDVWPPSRYVRPFFAVGVLGGYTTFSTYMLDTRALVVSDEPGRAAIYLLGTLGTGLVAVFAGLAVARGLMSRRHRLGDEPLPIDPDVDPSDLSGLPGHNDPGHDDPGTGAGGQS